MAFKDTMQQKDGVQIGLACGHPNVKPGETCPLCGKTLVQEKPNEQTGSS